MKRTSLILTILIIGLLSACSGSRPDFECSCEVNTKGWNAADTLHFPFHIPFLPTDTVLSLPNNLSLQLAIRYNATYPMASLPLHLRLVSSDGTALSGYSLKLSLTDSKGIPEGSGWGSLNTLEFTGLPYSLQIPDTGSYTLLIWPEATITDVATITAGFNQKEKSQPLTR